MQRCHSSHTVCRLIAPGLVLLVSTFGFTQGPGKDDPLASVSMDQLESEAPKAVNKCKDLFKGVTTLDPQDQNQEKAIDVLARYTLYRFHDVKANEPGYCDRVYQD